ncbi:MAG: low molecular weight phosphotyrosine protein phosphatase [Natronospirillum sp.]
MSATVKVLFVCLGNICRSPTAHGVFLKKVQAAGLASRVEIDSAGTAAYHIGKAPDARSQRAAQQQGYDLSALRARQVTAEDFADFDYVLAMDHQNLSELRVLHASIESSARCTPQLFLSFLQAAGSPDEVPDPYYGGADGFKEVLRLCEEAADALLSDIRERHAL